MMLHPNFREPAFLPPVDNQDIGSIVQTPSASELVFRALLTQDGAKRLELART